MAEDTESRRIITFLIVAVLIFQACLNFTQHNTANNATNNAEMHLHTATEPFSQNQQSMLTHPAVGYTIAFNPVFLNLTQPSAYRDLKVADLDLDGDDDIIVSGDKLSVLQNNLGSFSEFHLYSNLSANIAIGDLDNDYDKDIVFTAPEQTYNFRILRNNRNLNFETRLVANFSANYLAIADLDNDGDADIVTGTDRLCIWNNTGNFQFEIINVTPAIPQLSKFVIADLNLDGLKDIITVSNTTSQNILIWQNKGGFQFALANTIDIPALVHEIAIFDYDKNKLLDFTIVTEQELQIWQNTGGFGFQKHTIGQGLGRVVSLLTADFDNDADEDICTIADNKIQIWQNPFSLQPLSYSYYTAIKSAVVLDYDLDGDFEIAVASEKVSLYDNILVHRSRKTYLPFTYAMNISSAEIIHLATADANLDGLCDIIAYHKNGSLMVLYNPFWTAETICNLRNVSATALADLDLDADTDIIAGTTDGIVYALKNDRSSWQLLQILTVPASVTAIQLADLDNDADMDLIVGTNANSNNLYCTENVDAFAPAWNVRIVESALAPVTCLAVGDMDYDGFADVLSGSYGARYDLIAWRNTNFGFYERVVFEISAVTEIKTADLDNDGWLDILIGLDTAANNLIALNHFGEFGTKWFGKNIATLGVKISKFILADLDLDADADIIVCYNNTHTTCVDLLQNDKKFSFTVVRLGKTNVVDFAAADLELDADTDIVVCNDKLEIYKNIGGSVGYCIVDTALETPFGGELFAAFQISATNNGIARDNYIKPAYWLVRFTDSNYNPLTTFDAQNLLAKIVVYLDTGSGAFEKNIDIALFTLNASQFSLNATGYQCIDVKYGTTTHIYFGAPVKYFLVLQLNQSAAVYHKNNFVVSIKPDCDTAAYNGETNSYVSVEDSTITSTKVIKPRHRQFNVTFNVTTLVGERLNSTNYVEAYYYTNGTQQRVQIWDGYSPIKSCDANTTVKFDVFSILSTATERWVANNSIQPEWVVTTDMVCTAVYYQQFKADIILDGTDAYHTVSVEKHTFFGLAKNYTAVYGYWSGWCDAFSRLTFSEFTTGMPVLQAQNTRSWLVNSYLNATIYYRSLIARIEVFPAIAQLYIGQGLQFSAKAYDTNNTEVVGVRFNWTVSGGIGIVNSTGYFVAVSVGNGTVNASAYNITGYAQVSVKYAICPSEYAIWADSIALPKTIDWSGSHITVVGRVHSNNEIDISGSHNAVYGGTEYATNFTNTGSNNIFQPSPSVTAVAPPPINFTITDYMPGGRYAVAAQQSGEYHYIAGDFDVSATASLHGLYYVTGDVDLSGDHINGVFTIVAQGEIEVSGSHFLFKPYTSNGLMLFSNLTAPTAGIEISGSQGLTAGYIYAPNGLIELSGSNNAIHSLLLAEKIKLSGSHNLINVKKPVPIINYCRGFALLDNETVNVTIRIAGTKWHRVVLTVYEDTTAVGSVPLIRTPGAPNVGTVDVRINLSCTYTVTIDYESAQSGANPTWIVVGWRSVSHSTHLVFNAPPGSVQTETLNLTRLLDEMLSATNYVRFDGSASFDPDGWLVGFDWNFGDGSVASGAKVIHEYHNPGSYTVTLMVTDNNGLRENASVAITIQSAQALRSYATSARNTLQKYGLKCGAIVASPVETIIFDAKGGKFMLTDEMIDFNTAGFHKSIVITYRDLEIYLLPNTTYKFTLTGVATGKYEFLSIIGAEPAKIFSIKTDAVKDCIDEIELVDENTFSVMLRAGFATKKYNIMLCYAVDTTLFSFEIQQVAIQKGMIHKYIVTDWYRVAESVWLYVDENADGVPDVKIPLRTNMTGEEVDDLIKSAKKTDFTIYILGAAAAVAAVCVVIGAAVLKKKHRKKEEKEKRKEKKG